MHWRPINLSPINQISVCDIKDKDILLTRTYMFSTDSLYDPACTSNRAKLGSLSPGISTGVILHEAVMSTSQSRGGWDCRRRSWLEQPCMSNVYMESSINNPYYHVFAEHSHFQIPYIASKRVNLLKSGPICSFSELETQPNSNTSSVFWPLHRRTRAPSSASPSRLPQS